MVSENALNMIARPLLIVTTAGLMPGILLTQPARGAEPAGLIGHWKRAGNDLLARPSTGSPAPPWPNHEIRILAAR